MYSFYPVTEGIIFAQTYLPCMEGGKIAYCDQNTILLLHRKQAINFSGIISFSSEELAFYKDSSQQGGHAAPQFAAINKIKGSNSPKPLDRQPFTLAVQMNCESRVSLSLHGEGWQIVYSCTAYV